MYVAEGNFDIVLQNLAIFKGKSNKSQAVRDVQQSVKVSLIEH